MNLQLVRYCYGPQCVLGLLKIEELALWTVEKPWVGNQVFVSCIPDGTYPLVAFDSESHRNSWVITPVPGRTGILIHPGNTVDDVSGCIAPGTRQDGMVVYNSREACRMLNYVLDRKAQHTIQLGSGLGARLMPDPADPGDPLQSGSNNGNGESGMSPGGTS